MSERPRKPVLIELDADEAADPGAAPAPPDAESFEQAEGRAMERAMQLGRARLTFWARIGWGAGAGFVTLALSVAAWDFVTGLLARNEALGLLASVLAGVLGLALAIFAWRELAGYRRLRRLDALRARAEAALGAEDLDAARALGTELRGFYAGRAEMRWPCQSLAETGPDQMDAEGLLELTEATLMAPLDARARGEVEGAARRVALLTAIIPLPLVDVAAALITNLRMIRRIAEIYGGRAGSFGSLRLLRGVIAHLLATGAVAVGEDMLGAVASGGMVSKLSRRFGEGVVNGALTARLGIAAMEICRPLPFAALPRPRTSALLRRAVSGLFDRPPA